MASIPLTVLLWGLLAAFVITSIGRWCRAHPGPQATVAPAPTDGEDPSIVEERRRRP